MTQINTPAITGRISGPNIVIICPFCGKNHTHSLYPIGWRATHCGPKGRESITIDGITYERRNGYRIAPEMGQTEEK